jgi:hypothetical protein
VATIGCEHVQSATLNKCGRTVPTRDQLLDAWGNALRSLSGATYAAFVAGECVQVPGRLVVQLQRAGQRVQYLWGGVAIPTLLEANVVVGAHAR